MSQNLKAYLPQDVCYTPEDIVRNLAEQVPGRSIGDHFVADSKVNDEGQLILELDDGCKYSFTCVQIK